MEEIKMTREEKIEYIAESLDMEVQDISEEHQLADYENWDSIAVLSIISVINEKFNKFPHANEILKCKTVSDLMQTME
ncbi:MAG: hypothetical protein DBY03_01905 [Clostridiales bacterium]|jgi:phosphopantetheine attachment domain protein|nr:MAG: hypothetical protein DBY03_01905 [Clostridiales bacterium]